MLTNMSLIKNTLVYRHNKKSKEMSLMKNLFEIVNVILLVIFCGYSEYEFNLSE
jgi:hypothetical protein